MIPDKTVIPGLKFTREFFKFLKLMIGDFEGTESIPFFCEYYEEGKYGTEQSEDGWPIPPMPEDFDEMTYPFSLDIGPKIDLGLHMLCVVQFPVSKSHENNLLDIMDRTEGKLKLIEGLTAEEAYDYVSKKYKECSASWPTDEPWY